MSETIRNVYGDHAAIIPDDRQTHYDFGLADERERIIAVIREWANDAGWVEAPFDELVSAIKGQAE